MDTFSNLKIDNIPDFIKFGEDLINSYENTINKDIPISKQLTRKNRELYDNSYNLNDYDLNYLNNFKKYSRNYMNFLMNHTNFTYILVIYKQLLVSLKDQIQYIKHIILINNYILSIIINKNYKNNINIITNFVEYENYFKTAIHFQSETYSIIKLKNRLTPFEIVSYLNILDHKYENIHKFNNYEICDYIKFVFFIGYEIYYLTNCELLNQLLEELNKKNIHYIINIIHPIIKSFYNLLYKHFKNELNMVLDIMNMQKTIIETDSQIINKYMESVIIDDNSFFVNKNILVLGSIVGLLIYNIKI